MKAPLFLLILLTTSCECLKQYNPSETDENATTKSDTSETNEVDKSAISEDTASLADAANAFAQSDSISPAFSNPAPTFNSPTAPTPSVETKAITQPSTPVVPVLTPAPAFEAPAPAAVSTGKVIAPQTPPIESTATTTPTAPVTPPVTPQIAKAPTWEDHYQNLLSQYTSSQGVNYRALKANDTPKLLAVTAAIANTEASGSPQDHLAYYLNAYNVWMLKKAIDAYPVDSLLETDAQVYKRNDIKVGGRVMSLDYLENEIIRKDFQDSRIHFALNCASGGCPPLHNKILQGATLDQDLNLLTTNFLRTSGAQQQGSTLHISKLFDWFKSDFTRDSPDGTVLGYLKKYRSVSGSPSISYLDYSWKLNEVR